jgi:hypothetical protein
VLVDRANDASHAAHSGGEREYAALEYLALHLISRGLRETRRLDLDHRRPDAHLIPAIPSRRASILTMANGSRTFKAAEINSP